MWSLFSTSPEESGFRLDYMEIYNWGTFDQKVFRVSPFLIKVTQNLVSFFQDALNVSERLAFAEVTSSGVPLDDDMSNTYELLELKKEDSTSLESYIKEYYQQILKRLKEMEADLNIEEKKRLPF